jgi:hypothetical protein
MTYSTSTSGEVASYGGFVMTGSTLSGTMIGLMRPTTGATFPSRVS